MTECRFCGHVNAAEIQRCEDCGAWLPSQKSMPIADQDAEQAGADRGCLRDRLLALLWERQTMQAVKLYREEMGVGLREAKEVVEELADKHGISTPGVGCAGIFVLLLAASATFLGILSQ